MAPGHKQSYRDRDRDRGINVSKQSFMNRDKGILY